MNARAPAILATATRAVHDYATGPDGQTYAIGRALGAALFAGATPLPVAIGVYMARTQHLSLAEWGAFLGPAGAYYGAVAAAAIGLIQLTNWTEPRAAAPAGDAQ